MVSRASGAAISARLVLTKMRGARCCWWWSSGTAHTLVSSSKVKTPRKSASHQSMKAAFGVPFGSSGDSQAIVAQLAMIVSRMIGSKGGDSTSVMASRLGPAAGVRQNDVPS